MEGSRVRWLLILATVGYLAALLVVTSPDRPTVALLAFVPLVIAGSAYGMRVALVFAIGLAVVTFAVIELMGPGIGNVLGTYRGVPLLIFVMTGVVVGHMRDLRTEIESELAQRREIERELRETQRRLEELLAAKDELIASVGHELRTPLTAVLGFAEMLKIGDESDMTRTDRVEMVNFISREAFVLSAIIDDLLVAARLEVGKLEVTRVPTSPHAQLAQVLETWEPDTVARVRIVGGQPKALADPGRVRQILRNLITNALRYGGDDVVVDLASDSEAVVVEVRDNGPGLPEEDWERIFEPYYSSHAGSTQPGSVGLGLTVSRRLAHLMGGDLTYRYQNGMSVFSFRLPIAGVQV